MSPQTLVRPNRTALKVMTGTMAAGLDRLKACLRQPRRGGPAGAGLDPVQSRDGNLAMAFRAGSGFVGKPGGGGFR